MNITDFENQDVMEMTPEMCREIGKKLYIGSANNSEERNKGLQLLMLASNKGDNEARYIIGSLLIDEYIRIKGNPIEKGLSLLCIAANNGYLPARILLNKYCENEYKKTISKENFSPETDQPLTDFDGKKIKINHSGILSPIDAKLEFIEGKNILTLSTNISFIDSTDVNIDLTVFKKAVLDGIHEWAGDYEVFGGQKLKVVLNVTTESRIFDNVLVIPVTKDFKHMITKMREIIGSKNSRKNTEDIINTDRSMAVTGLKKWSVTSRKYIYMQSKNGKFDDYEELKSVAKHEFGHALGLGDLYYSPNDNLNGVEKGSFKELDDYYITDKFYNLVMCDHHGPISNNDIEMVVLAFSENRKQNYQLNKIMKKISKALGRGN